MKSCHAWLWPIGFLLLAAGPVPAEQADNEAVQRISPRNCEAWQEKVDQLQASDDEFERSLGELYAQPELTFCRSERRRVSAERESRNWNINFPDLGILAPLARVLMIALLIGLCLWLVWRWRRYLPGRAEPGKAGRQPPVGARTTRINEDSPLPADIPGAARAAWHDDQPRLAMSLLYRGAVHALLARQHREQARTEREVLDSLRALGPDAETLGYMQGLVNHWLRTAWADQPPAPETFAQLHQQWSVHCRPGTGQTP